MPAPAAGDPRDPDGGEDSEEKAEQEEDAREVRVIWLRAERIQGVEGVQSLALFHEERASEAEGRSVAVLRRVLLVPPPRAISRGGTVQPLEARGQGKQARDEAPRGSVPSEGEKPEADHRFP